MSISIGRYTFREIDGRMRACPRTQNDFKHREHFERAAAGAENVKSEVHQTYLDVLALDQTESDLNDRIGEVLIKDQPMAVGEVSGHAFSTNGPGAAVRDVMDVGIQRGDSRAVLKYTLDPDQDYVWARRTLDAGTDRAVKEQVSSGSYVRDGVTEYSIQAEAGAGENFLSLTQPPYAPDEVPSPPRETVKTAGMVLLDDKLTFEPRTLVDLMGIEEHREMIHTGNEARDLVTSVYQGVLAMDGTAADLNPKPGEVLFQNASIEGRSLTGYLSELQVQKGNTQESIIGGTFPHLVAYSEESGEKFQAVFPTSEGWSETTHFLHAPGMRGGTYIHDDGKREVQVDLSHYSSGDSTPALVTLREAPKPKEKVEKKSWWQRLLG